MLSHKMYKKLSTVSVSEEINFVCYFSVLFHSHTRLTLMKKKKTKHLLVLCHIKMIYYKQRKKK